jgi:dCMP deaminase
MTPRMIDYYMRAAELTATLSRARRLQVGCVIVKNHNIISFSWNGTPSGWDNECEFKEYDLARDLEGNHFPGSEKEYPFHDELGRYRLKTKPEVVHSEMNALMKLARGTESGQGAAMFITHSPCIECAKGIVQSGISSVYYRNHYRSHDGLSLLSACGVKVEKI